MRVFCLCLLLGLLSLSGSAPALAREPEPGAKKQETRCCAVSRALAGLSARGELSEEKRREALRLYRKLLKRAVKGSKPERVVMRGLRESSEYLASHRMLHGARLRALQLTWRVNLEWFAAQSSPASGTRLPLLPGSPLIWQFYPGEGWQLQPLANWGEVHRLLGSQQALPEARALSLQLLELRVRRRGGGWANEYLFPWQKSRPGWVSAMPIASSLLALEQLYQRSGEARFQQAAREGLQVLRARAPAGTLLRRGPGRAHLLLYSGEPGMRVGNGFLSASKSLYDYAQLSKNPRAQALLQQALKEARRSLPEYETSAWSRYSAGGAESDLHYHRLFRQFASGLCLRVQGEFCAFAQRLQVYESEPIRLKQARVSWGRKRAILQLWLSKRGSLRVSLWRGERVLLIRQLPVTRGRLRLELKRAGGERVKVEAFSLNRLPSQSEFFRPLPPLPPAQPEPPPALAQLSRMLAPSGWMEPEPPPAWPV